MLVIWRDRIFPRLTKQESSVKHQSGHQAEPSNEAAWDALATIRETLEEALPPGWVRPADETQPTIVAEINAIVDAIRAMAAAIPPERLTDKSV
jgi:hypothetical protein